MWRGKARYKFSYQEEYKLTGDIIKWFEKRFDEYDWTNQESKEKRQETLEKIGLGKGKDAQIMGFIYGGKSKGSTRDGYNKIEPKIEEVFKNQREEEQKMWDIREYSIGELSRLKSQNTKHERAEFFTSEKLKENTIYNLSRQIFMGIRDNKEINRLERLREISNEVHPQVRKEDVEPAISILESGGKVWWI